MCLFNIEKSGPEKAEGNVADKKESVSGPENYLNKHTSGFGFIYSHKNKLRDVTEFLVVAGIEQEKGVNSMETLDMVPPNIIHVAASKIVPFASSIRQREFFQFQATSVFFEWFERTRKKINHFLFTLAERYTNHDTSCTHFLERYFVCFEKKSISGIQWWLDLPCGMDLSDKNSSSFWRSWYNFSIVFQIRGERNETFLMMTAFYNKAMFTYKTHYLWRIFTWKSYMETVLVTKTFLTFFKQRGLLCYKFCCCLRNCMYVHPVHVNYIIPLYRYNSLWVRWFKCSKNRQIIK